MSTELIAEMTEQLQEELMNASMVPYIVVYMVSPGSNVSVDVETHGTD